MSDPGTARQRLEADPARRGRRLEYLTLAWNSVEAVVSIMAGVAAGSTALIGFGMDAVVESASGGILLWRLQDGGSSTRERRALQLVGVTFLVLASWVGVEAIRSLVAREAPSASYVGIVVAALSLLVMPWLARQKRMVARDLGSSALEADSRQTDLCAVLSAILLTGLALNAAFGWWWVDSVAALIMVPVIVTEGVQALRGERCEC
ncbi:MAG: cation diffusion facilitator family transporter [Longimicrobiales bacterium]